MAQECKRHLPCLTTQNPLNSGRSSRTLLATRPTKASVQVQRGHRQRTPTQNTICQSPSLKAILKQICRLLCHPDTHNSSLNYSVQALRHHDKILSVKPEGSDFDTKHLVSHGTWDPCDWMHASNPDGKAWTQNDRGSRRSKG
jgi:hypothetical protein